MPVLGNLFANTQAIRVGALFVKWLSSESLTQGWRAVFGRPWPLRTRNAPSAASAHYKFAIRAPWPQPNPHNPDKLAPSVLHLPKGELVDFLKVTKGRLNRTLRREWRNALTFALAHPETPPVTDDLFTRTMNESLFSRSMSLTLDADDRAVLGRLASGDGELFKQDLSPAAMVEPLSGTYLSGPTVYTRRVAPGRRCEPVGIAFPQESGLPLLIQPEDGPAWELAKHHAVMAAFYTGLFGTHPLVHFPVDAINALTKSILPPEHVVARLLEPHSYIQLCLNFSVMFIDMSPLHNLQIHPFTGVTNDGPRSALAVMAAVYSGIEGNETYPGYRWSTEPQLTYSDYGTFLEGYRPIIRTFVREVLEGVDRSDPDLMRWFRECSDHVRGFPLPDAISEPGVLEDTLTHLIWNAAIAHSADHYSFGTLPQLPHLLRIRVPPPTRRDMPPLDRSTFTTIEDRFRMYMTHRMHLEPNTETHLQDVRYSFRSADRQSAADRFVEAMRAYDATPGCTHHAPLTDIACSIQY